MRGSIAIENMLFSRNYDINITNAKSITDDSIWVMFISKISDMLEIAEHSLFNSPIIIRCCGFHFRSTDLADKTHSYTFHRIPCQFVNKPGPTVIKLFEFEVYSNEKFGQLVS